MIPLGAVVRPRTMCWSLPQILVETILRITPCSHFRLPSASFGEFMLWTSTLPGPMYATPRLLAIRTPPLGIFFRDDLHRRGLERGCSCRGHGMVLLTRTAADPDGAHYLAIT